MLPTLKTVKGYCNKEGRNVDQTRPVTRQGAKKALSVELTSAQARSLKLQMPCGRC